MLSEKQIAAIGHGQTPNDTHNILVANGVTRSGKTFSCLAGFFAHSQALGESYKHLLLGKKLTVIEQELLPQIEEMCEAWGTPCHYDRYDKIFYAGGQTYHLCAGNDEESYKRVQGMTIGDVFCDEATLIPESFWNMAVTRMSFDWSRMWGTCNPDGPQHWLKKKWIDEQLVRYMDFRFEDNPKLTETVIRRLKAQFSGVFAKRYVQGLWAAAEGLIWDKWTERKLDLNDYYILRSVLGTDYGSASPSAFIPLHQLRHKVSGEIKLYVSGAHKIEGTQKSAKTDVELVDIGMAFAVAAQTQAFIVDPSAASLKAALRKKMQIVRDAKNDVIPGLRRTGAVLATEECIISPEAVDLLEEMASYSWDPKKEDTPLKQNDHCCDGFRYAVMDMADLPTHTIGIPQGM